LTSSPEDTGIPTAVGILRFAVHDLFLWVENTLTTVEQVKALAEESHEQIGIAEDRITEIASANDDQASTIEGITTTVEDIVEATNRQTQVVQEPYGSVDELTDR